MMATGNHKQSERGCDVKVTHKGMTIEELLDALEIAVAKYAMGQTTKEEANEIREKIMDRIGGVVV